MDFDRTNAKDLIGRDVVNNNGDQVGTVGAAWLDDESGQLAYLGVRSGAVIPDRHVIPAVGVRLDGEGRVVVPYDEETIRMAPEVDFDADITPAMETRIRSRFAALPPRGEERTREAGEEAVIPLREEEVHVGKREVPGQAVRLRKVVRTETEEVPVELRREEIHVERVPPGEVPRDAQGRPFEESDEVVLQASHEEPVVEKETRVTGGVRAYTTEETERRKVEGQVRREDVEVDRGGRPGA